MLIAAPLARMGIVTSLVPRNEQLMALLIYGLVVDVILFGGLFAGWLASDKCCGVAEVTSPGTVQCGELRGYTR